MPDGLYFLYILDREETVKKRVVVKHWVNYTFYVSSNRPFQAATFVNLLITILR
jgi:hypothetical protein